MLGATHFIVGAAIYRLVKPKPLGLVLAFGSHFALDAVPHHELSMMGNGVLLAAAFTGMAYIAWRIRNVRLLVAGLLGLAPDLNWIFQISSTLNTFHSYVHYHSTTLSIPTMVGIEILVFVAGASTLIRAFVRQAIR